MNVDLNHELTRGFAAQIIRRKAKQLIRRPEFNASDLPDLQQEMKLHLIERLPKFDPEVAHWNVFVTTVVERHVASILEFKAAEKRVDEHEVESLNELVEDCEGNVLQRAQLVGQRDRDRMAGEQTRDDQEHVAMQLDVERVMTELPPDLRELCEQLKSKSVSELARELHLPRQTLADKVRRIRDVFEEHDMQWYFAPGS